MLDFPVLYTNGKVGTATLDLAIPGTDLQPLFEQIVQTIPVAKGDPDGPLQILVTNLDYSDYLGRLAIGRVFNGTMRTGEEYNVARVDDTFSKHKITKLFSFSGLKRTDIDETQTGDIVAIAGIPGITIGESFCDVENPQPLPRIAIDDPTIAIQFNVNNSPFAGREGRWVTSRNLRDRLEKEMLTNVSLKMLETGSPDSFKVLGRGELQLAILIEMMRREGFEMMVSRPEIVTKRIDGKLMEPVEQLMIDIPENFVGTVIERLGPRKGEMTKMTNHGSGRVRMEFRIPSRGLIGLRSEMLTETRGTIVMNAILDGYVAYQGEIPQRVSGALISRPPGNHHALRAGRNPGPRHALRPRRHRGLRGHDHRRALARQRPRRQLRAREEHLQHARLQRRRSHPPRPLPQPHAGAVHRVHRRGRAGRGHPQVPPPAQASPPGQPPPPQRPARRLHRLAPPAIPVLVLGICVDSRISIAVCQIQ